MRLRRAVSSIKANVAPFTIPMLDHNNITAIIVALIAAVPLSFSASAAWIKIRMDRDKESAGLQVPDQKPWWREPRVWNAVLLFLQSMVGMFGLGVLCWMDPPLSMRWVGFAVLMATLMVVAGLDSSRR